MVAPTAVSLFWLELVNDVIAAALVALALRLRTLRGRDFPFFHQSDERAA